MPDDNLDYQKVPQVAQLRAECANADAYGATDRCTGINEQLTTLGADVP